MPDRLQPIKSPTMRVGMSAFAMSSDPGQHRGPGEDAVEVRARTSFGDITINRSFAADSGKDQT